VPSSNWPTPHPIPEAGAGVRRGGPDPGPRDAMATAFSSDGEAALRRELGPAAAAPRGDFDGFYEMGRAAAFVRGGGFRKVSGAGAAAGPGPAGRPSRCVTPSRVPLQVALQFPDELLADAAAVAARMEAATGAAMYVLGDTTYGRSVRGRGGGGVPGSSRAGAGLRSLTPGPAARPAAAAWTEWPPSTPVPRQCCTMARLASAPPESCRCCTSSGGSPWTPGAAQRPSGSSTPTDGAVWWC